MREPIIGAVPAAGSWASVVQRAARGLGAAFVNFDDAPRARRGEFYVSGDEHWNVDGNKLGYRYLVPRIRSELPNFPEFGRPLLITS